MVWLGTLDARVSMNLPVLSAKNGNEPEWVEAEALLEATLKKHNKPRASSAFEPAIKTDAEKGYSCKSLTRTSGGNSC
jgi:hypothetical protein